MSPFFLFRSSLKWNRWGQAKAIKRFQENTNYALIAPHYCHLLAIFSQSSRNLLAQTDRTSQAIPWFIKCNKTNRNLASADNYSFGVISINQELEKWPLYSTVEKTTKKTARDQNGPPLQSKPIKKPIIIDTIMYWKYPIYCKLKTKKNSPTYSTIYQSYTIQAIITKQGMTPHKHPLGGPKFVHYTEY